MVLIYEVVQKLECKHPLQQSTWPHTKFTFTRNILKRSPKYFNFFHFETFFFSLYIFFNYQRNFKISKAGERYDAELSKNGVKTCNVYHRQDEKNSGIRRLRKKNCRQKKFLRDLKVWWSQKCVFTIFWNIKKTC